MLSSAIEERMQSVTEGSEKDAVSLKAKSSTTLSAARIQH